MSFFGPFYGGYHIAKLDPDYRMVLITGPSLEYGWILSRSEDPGQSMCDDYVGAAESLGIDRQSWLWIRSCE